MSILDTTTCPTCRVGSVEWLMVPLEVSGLIDRLDDPHPICDSCKGRAEKYHCKARFVHVTPDDSAERFAAEIQSHAQLSLEAVTAPRRGKAVRDAPATSHDQAERIRPRTGTQRARMLALFHRGGYLSEGWTDHELVAELGIILSSVHPRRGELTDDGWIEDSGKRRNSPSGNPMIVWQLTAAARAELDANPIPAPARGSS